MKVLIIHGSPRRGNTWDTLNVVKSKISEKIDARYDLLELSKINLNSCIGCFNCILKSESKCPHFDIMKDIVKRVDGADVLIITSPVYSLQVSGILKNFIDHMSYNFHRPKYFTKRAFIITTTAGVAERNIANYLEEVMNSWGITSVYKVSIKYRDEIYDKDMKLIDKEVNKLVREFKSNYHKSPSMKNIAYYNAWRSMSTTFYEKGNVDYDYWVDSGMSRYSYHPDIKINKAKSILGHLMYKGMSKGMAKKKNKELLNGSNKPY